MRLFVGLPLPETIRDRLAMLGGGVPGARWVAPEAMHITLRFIGEVDPGQAEDIDAALADIDAPGFSLMLSGVGHFGSGRKIHSLWAGVEAADALRHLQAKAESAVVRAGFPPEGRKFMPHVTLARLKGAAPPRVGAFIQANNAFLAGPVEVVSFTLFRSHLGHEGARYEALESYPLS